jgi:threonine synthase
VGIPKGYEELRAMDWVSGPLPRFFAVQAEGCAPVVEAWRAGRETTSAWDNPTTHAAGLRVPSPFAGRQMLRVLRETGGGAVAVSEDAIRDAQRRLARVEGIWTSPEGAALVAALARLRDEGAIASDARIVLVLTGAGIKYDPPAVAPAIDLVGSDEDVVGQVRRAVGA